MGYSLNKLSYDIIETYRENYKDTDALSIRRVRDWIHNTRAMLIEQRFAKSIHGVGKVFHQDLTNISLELVDVSSTPATYSFGDVLLQTTIDIPYGIDMPDELEAMVRISSINRADIRFRFVDADMLPYLGSGRYDYSTIYVFRIGDKLGLWSKDDSFKALAAIDITIIAVDPVAVARIENSNYSFDDLYPVSEAMAKNIKNIIYKDYLRITINPPVDKTEDNEHNLTKE